MIKQVVFLKRRPDLTMQEFMDYYENQHSQLSKRMGAKPALPNAQRYVRRYVRPEKNPVTLEEHDPGYDCIMEIWWNSREDFENSQRIISDPARLPMTKADEERLFASHANPVCTCIEYDSPMGPNGEATQVEVKYEN